MTLPIWVILIMTEFNFTVTMHSANKSNYCAVKYKIIIDDFIYGGQYCRPVLSPTIQIVQG